MHDCPGNNNSVDYLHFEAVFVNAILRQTFAVFKEMRKKLVPPNILIRNGVRKFHLQKTKFMKIHENQLEIDEKINRVLHRIM